MRNRRISPHHYISSEVTSELHLSECVIKCTSHLSDIRGIDVTTKKISWALRLCEVRLLFSSQNKHEDEIPPKKLYTAVHLMWIISLCVTVKCCLGYQCSAITGVCPNLWQKQFRKWFILLKLSHFHAVLIHASDGKGKMIQLCAILASPMNAQMKTIPFWN